MDGRSIADFEIDLRDNLYKIWNQMSLGIYFLTPVMALEMPRPACGLLAQSRHPHRCPVAQIYRGRPQHGHPTARLRPRTQPDRGGLGPPETPSA